MARVSAVTLDFWDTLYVGGAPRAEQKAAVRAAVRRMLAAYERELDDDALTRLHQDTFAEFERVWREEQRGYTTTERLHWMLRRAECEPTDECPHVAEAARAVDDALLRHPPPLLPGAADAVRALAAHFRLAIISDTGFASGAAQDRVLAQDGLLEHFRASIYSMDIGHTKPRPEPFRAALDALAVPAHEVVHIGDIERSDVAGALGSGLRAIRLDALRDSGPSAAELVARSWDEVVAYLAGSDEPRVE